MQFQSAFIFTRSYQHENMQNWFLFYSLTSSGSNIEKTFYLFIQLSFICCTVNKSGTVWGVFLSLLFLGIIGTVLFYYRRRVANLKKEINHVVQYMTEDRNNFDNPVYSYQQTSINTDASTLLHRNGVMNNLRQTKPSNMDRLNNFDHDSNSSGRAAAYSLQYDSQLMNQKNHDADQTNPNFYNAIDDHLYDEIKLKGGDLGKGKYSIGATIEIIILLFMLAMKDSN